MRDCLSIFFFFNFLEFFVFFFFLNAITFVSVAYVCVYELPQNNDTHMDECVAIVLLSSSPLGAVAATSSEIDTKKKKKNKKGQE